LAHFLALLHLIWITHVGCLRLFADIGALLALLHSLTVCGHWRTLAALLHLIQWTSFCNIRG
jgi:hypothetical protein